MRLTGKAFAIGDNAISKIYRGNKVAFDTGELEVFEAPASTVTNASLALGGYARNIWDMQVYGSRIYIGIGNSSTNGPTPNAGPIPVYYFDPTTEQYTTEFMVDEEQINIFKIIEGDLYIPGHDPTESWALGNFYKTSGNGWSKHRNIPNGIHTYDMAYYDGKLFAALGSGTNPPLVVSNDMGATWSTAYTGAPGIGRFYTVFEFKGSVYAISMLRTWTNFESDVYELKRFNGTNFVDIALGYGANMVPTLSMGFYKIIKPTTFSNKLLYIAGTDLNDHQTNPVALFVADEIDQLSMVSKVTFAEATAIPRDIIVRGSKVYVLTSVCNAEFDYTVIVYESTDLTTWTQTVSFASDAYAQSFEEYSGRFYFGLGCTTTEIPASVGNIVKLGY